MAAPPDVITIPQSERDPAKIVFSLRQAIERLNGTGFFHVHRSANQSVTSGVESKVSFNTIVSGTNSNNWYDSVTSYRYTPQIAGVYEFHMNVETSATVTLDAPVAAIRKNNSTVGYGTYTPVSGLALMTHVSALVPLNGTTDYVEGFIYCPTNTVSGTSTKTYMMGIRVA